ncbi:hypothetical protein [Ottowia sp.]|uniref:hypothetical protein n=1 Tax=Ottowia sp. TaxID=1898956 RepID=UPI0025FF4D87|nr:hypothetical protein [Ottowia sp.]
MPDSNAAHGTRPGSPGSPLAWARAISNGMAGLSSSTAIVPAGRSRRSSACNCGNRGSAGRGAPGGSHRAASGISRCSGSVEEGMSA